MILKSKGWYNNASIVVTSCRFTMAALDSHLPNAGCGQLRPYDVHINIIILAITTDQIPGKLQMTSYIQA